MKPEQGAIVAIVDDDVLVCRSIRRLAASYGLAVNSFTCGREFMTAIEGEPSFEPDCVILDLELPGMTGLNVFEARTRLRPHIPVVVLTGADDARSPQLGVLSGALAFLHKPLDIDRLMAILRALLGAGS